MNEIKKDGGGMERRQFPRTPLAVSLEICEEGSNEHIGKGFVTNLSEGGLALETPRMFARGDEVVFRFSLPDEKPFDVKSEVLYAKDGVFTRAYGARFRDPHPEVLKKIRVFVRSRENH